MRWTAILMVIFALAGCAPIPKSESDVFDEVIQLTSGYEAASEASFSKDMNWIIFQAIPKGEKNYQMYLARLLKADDRVTGIGQAIRISPHGSKNSSGAFSPDGVSIIFASTAGQTEENAASESAMEIFRADAWQGAIAATEFSRGINLARNKLTNNSFSDAECSFSPDGKWILFTSDRNADPTRPENSTRDTDIYLMKSDGTNIIPLTRNRNYDGTASFSPDGQQIVFRSDRKDQQTIQIYVAELDIGFDEKITGLTRIKQLTDDNAIYFRPTWHANGTHLFYASNKHDPSDFDLYMMRTDGSRQLKITFNSAHDVLPAMSSDGKYLMWTSRRSADHTAQIYIGRFKMPAAG